MNAFVVTEEAIGEEGELLLQNEGCHSVTVEPVCFKEEVLGVCHENNVLGG